MQTLVEQSGPAKVQPLHIGRASNLRASLLDVATLVFAGAVFLTLCLYQLQLPGLYNDEAFDVIPAMQLLLGHPVELQRNAAVHLFGLSLPLMSSSDYQGVTSTYLALPFLAVGGVNVISLRLMTVSVGLLGIVLAFFLARTWFGRAEARLTVLMLAFSPAWVFWSRLGVYVVSEVVPIATGSLLAFTYWVRRQPLGMRNGSLYVGMFLLGLGLSTKLLFLWFILAVAFCGLILCGARLWASRRVWLGQWKLWAKACALSLGAFCLGAFPFLLYNLMTRGTFNLLRGSLSNLGATTHGVNNTAFVRNLWTEADALKIVLDGGYFWFQGIAAKTYSNPLTPALFALSALGLMAFAIPARGKLEKTGTGDFAWLGMSIAGAPAALGLVMSGLLAIGVESVPTSAAIVAAILLGVIGTLLLVWSALRGGLNAKQNHVKQNRRLAEWALWFMAAASGAVWWFAGQGRPETPAPGGPLGLWPVDAAGVLFWAAGAGLAVVLGWNRLLGSRARAALAALVLIGLIVAQSAVTISGLWSTHLIVLIPLPQMVIAAFVVQLGRRLAGMLKGSAPVQAALRALPAALLVGAVLVGDGIVDYSYHRDMALGGGRSTFSDAIYSLSSYLEGLDSHPKVVAMDWGFRRPIQFLTSERVDPIEAYGYSAAPTPEFYEGLSGLLKDPNTVYLFHDDNETAYPRFEAFQQAADRQGKNVVLDKTFMIRDGSVVYRLYSAK